MSGPVVNPWSECFSLFFRVLFSPGFAWATFIIVSYGCFVFLVAFIATLFDWTAWRPIYRFCFDGPLAWAVFAVAVVVMIRVGV